MKEHHFIAFFALNGDFLCNAVEFVTVLSVNKDGVKAPEAVGYGLNSKALN